MTDIVRLKPLEWVNHGHDYWYATTIFGTYSAHAINMASTDKYWIHRPDKLETKLFPTIDDAKAACEADYRERIAPAADGVRDEGWAANSNQVHQCLDGDSAAGATEVNQSKLKCDPILRDWRCNMGWQRRIL